MRAHRTIYIVCRVIRSLVSILSAIKTRKYCWFFVVLSEWTVFCGVVLGHVMHAGLRLQCCPPCPNIRQFQHCVGLLLSLGFCFFHDIMTLDIVFTLFRELGVNDLRKNCTLYIASFSELYRVLTSTTETGDKLYVLSSFIISSVEILGKP